MTPVNPHEGQIAIPYSKGTDGAVVGVLGARAIRWVEETTDVGFDAMYLRFARSMHTGNPTGIRYAEAAAVVWAAIEHHRRRQGLPGPEWTMDDADAIAEEIGRSEFYSKAFGLMFWSITGRAIRERERAQAETDGLLEEYEAGMGEAEALAGIGTPTSAPPSPPASTTTPSGT